MRSELRKIAIIVGPLAVIAAGLGCEQVLGLDQFRKVDAAACDEAAACSDAGGADAPIDAPADVSLPDVVNLASSWAHNPMPSSSTEVQLGANPATAATFTPGSGFATDDITKLTWNTSTSPGTFTTIDDAASYCKGLGGTWRLPTRIELASLLDTTTAGAPYVTPVLGDAGVRTATYWTSSYYRPLQGSVLHYWFVSFSDGNVVHAPAGDAAVICVQ